MINLILQDKNASRGFSLIELSLVLVVVSLIVGGVMVANHLMRAAQLRSIISETQNIQTALHAFSEKYDALAGDMPNATSFFTGTTNGAGDRRMTWGNNSTTYDGYRAFQHLALAGMIKGEYPGTGLFSGPSYPTPQSGVSTPAPSLTGAAYGFAVYSSGFNVNFYKYGGRSLNGYAYLTLGQNATSYLYGGGTNQGVLTPREIISLEEKIDDGLPGKGSVIVYRSGGCTTLTCTAGTSCVTTGNPETSVYRTNDTVSCVPVFLLEK